MEQPSSALDARYRLFMAILTISAIMIMGTLVAQVREDTQTLNQLLISNVPTDEFKVFSHYRGHLDLIGFRGGAIESF